MNWNKVMNLMILLFVILNITMYGVLNISNSNKYNLSEERKQQMEEMFKKKEMGIYVLYPSHYPKSRLELKVPKYDTESITKNIFKGKNYEITYDRANSLEVRSIGKETLSFAVEDKEKTIYYKTDKPTYRIPSESEADINTVAIKFAEDFINETGIYEVTYFDKIENGHLVILNEKYREQWIFDNYVEIVFNDKGIIQAVGKRNTPSGFLGDENDIVPFDEAMYHFIYYMEERELEQVFIIDVDVGYYFVDTEDKIIKDADPYYRVILENYDRYYINAYTNDIYAQE